MVYGYARVSTRGQATDGNSLTAQTRQLMEAGVDMDNIYSDSFTGTKMDRPQFSALLSVIQPGDTLVVCKLDRFARSMAQASELITELINKGITVNVLNLGILSNSSVNTLLRNVLLCFSQFERDMILERTQEGKAIAKQKPGFKEGRPRKYTDLQIQHAVSLLDTMSYSKVTAITGISKSTLIRAKKKTTG